MCKFISNVNWFLLPIILTLTSFHNPIFSQQNQYNNHEDFWIKFNNDSLYLFSYYDSEFSIIINPVLIGNYRISEDNTIFHTGNGINLYGKAFKNINYKFLFYDNHEKWNSPLKFRRFSRETGIHQVVLGDYSELIINMNYEWSNGKIAVGKDYFSIGSGHDGQLIMSNKAPSFPFISLDYQPTKWLKFKYIHAWLNSGLVDSNTIKYTGAIVKSYSKTYDSRKKYLALHYITVLPWKNLEVTLGESMVYSDNIELLYILPINFYRLSDHYLSNGDNGDNAQIFGDIKYSIPQYSSEIYSTLFIDELQLGKVLSGDNGGTKHLGFTIGLQKNNILVNNNKFSIEYTRINPFVYNNFNPAQTYYSSGYQLGHWIGSNTEQFHVEYEQLFFDKLSAKIMYDYIRKGKKETVDEQYTLPNPPFLYGTKSIYEAFELQLKYTPFHPLQFFLEYQHLFKNTNRFQTEYGYIDKNYLNIGLSFGLY